jgi:nucleotide-binding universal stress UspA family protein
VPTARRVLDSEILSSDLPVDIGPWTVSRIKGLIDGANTIIWNGPLGIWEIAPFAEGTRAVAKLFTEHVSPRYQGSIVCGDSLSRAIHSFDLPIEHFPHLTPGGEPALRLLAGNRLPGVSALTNEAEVASPIAHRKRRILLPVDGSDHSLEAVGKIGSLVNGHETHIYLVHVASQERQLEQIFNADRIFSAANAALAAQGLISHDQVMLEGSPADEILKFADQNGVDLIAMGSHGLTGVLRLVMGSVSRKVLDQAKCPVLIVRVPDVEMVKAGLLEV